MEENKWHFWHVMLYYFKKGKNATEMQVNIYTVYGEGVMTDRTCQKCFVKFCAGDFSCCTMLHGQVEQLKLIAIKSRHYWEESTLYHAGDSWHTQNIQIHKVIGENEKKCVFYFVEWKPYRLFGQPNILHM